jgi:sarcosine oxidase subunit gamma
VLRDLSALPRFGLKGHSTGDWLDARSYQAGSAVNHAYPQGDGCLIARLSPTELLFLCDPEQAELNMDHDYFTPGRACYPVRRRDSHCWFAMTGPNTPEVLARLCGVNFDAGQFPNHRVAQTRVAATTAIVLRDDHPDNMRFYLLADSSCAEYLWACVHEAIGS